MALRIKKGDIVEVRAGKDKGKKGKVLKVLDNARVRVEGVNLVKKHMRRRREGDQGGIVEVPGYIHISNVNLFCPKCNRGVRFGVKVTAEKGKVRVCKKCGQII